MGNSVASASQRQSVGQPFPPDTWEQFSQQKTLPAGVVDYQAAMTIDDQWIVEHIRRCRNESKRARQPLEPDWFWFKDLYRARFDDSEKDDWQARCFVPKITSKIQTAISLVKSALLDSPQWNTFEKANQGADESQIRLVGKVVNLLLDDANFVAEYTHALREGFLLGTGVLRFSWETWTENKPEIQVPPIYSNPQAMMMAQMRGMQLPQPTVAVQPRERNGLKICQVPLWSMYPDPWARRFADCKYVIEEFACDREEIEEKVASGMYYPDLMDRIGEPMSYDLERQYRWWQTDLNIARSSARKRDLIQEYHGNLYDRTGKLALKNWRVTLVNQRAVARCGPNPFYTGRSPYLWSTPIPHDSRPWGISVVEADAQQQEEFNKLVNLTIDNVLYAVMQAFTVDPAKVEEATDLTSIEPGKVYHASGEDPIKPLQFNTNAINAVLPVLQILTQSMQEGSIRISDNMQGKPTARGRPTAEEISNVADASSGSMHGLARDLEEGDLEPALQMTYELAMQFLSDDSNPRLKDLIQEYAGAQVPLQNPIARMQLLDVPFKVRARGISMLLKRGEMVNKLMNAVQIAQQLGIPALNTLLIFYEVIQAMGIDPAELGFAPDPQAQAMIVQQMMAAQAAQAGNGGAGPGAGAQATPGQTPSSGAGVPQPPHPNDLMRQNQAPHAGA